MLYVTSRNKLDSFPAQRALRQQRGPDGGLYIPMRIQPLDSQELDELLHGSFNQGMAMILNRFFGTRLTGLDLDFAVGRNPVRMRNFSHRIAVAECWHNTDWDFSGMVNFIYPLLIGEPGGEVTPAAELGIRTAVMTAAAGSLIRDQGISRESAADLVVTGGNLFGVISGLQVKALGLPIGNVVCCCNENAPLWDLLHSGALRTDGLCISTQTPEADITLPAAMEALISLRCGSGEVENFLEICRRGGNYCPAEEILEKLHAGIQVSVVSGRRMRSTIPNILSTNSYLLSPYSALCYAGLLDYRARTGESRLGLILAEKNPVSDLEIVASALGKTSQELLDHIKKN